MSNRTRAERAGEVVNTYGEEPGDIEPTVIDLLSDLLHFIRFERGLSPSQAVEMLDSMVSVAEMNFEAEVD